MKNGPCGVVAGSLLRRLPTKSKLWWYIATLNANQQGCSEPVRTACFAPLSTNLGALKSAVQPLSPERAPSWENLDGVGRLLSALYRSLQRAPASLCETYVVISQIGWTMFTYYWCPQDVLFRVANQSTSVSYTEIFTWVPPPMSYGLCNCVFCALLSLHMYV